jgi:hypothetical protein
MHEEKGFKNNPRSGFIIGGLWPNRWCVLL